jgi:flagellar hook-associated protein 3 FlgL
MRIADNTRFDAMRQSMATSQAQYFKASREASSGVRVGAPSDDPVAAAQALRVQSAMDRTTAYRASIRTVQSDVELAESSLADAKSDLDRAHEIALQAGSGQMNADERKTLGLEAAQLKEHLVSIANAKGGQGYLFGGTKTAAAPFSSTGAFSGDDLDRNIEIANGVSSTVSTSGAKAFTAAGGRDVFADLDALVTALNSNDQAGVLATVNSLDASGRQVLAARVDAGLKVAKLDAADTAHEQTSVSLSTSQQALVGSDPAQAYSRLAQAQQGVDQAISVSKNILDTLRATQF